MQVVSTHKGAKLYEANTGSERVDMGLALQAARRFWHSPVITSGTKANTLNVYTSHEYGRDNRKYLAGYITLVEP